MSMKGSTAALEPSASRSLPNQRRAPRHPAAAKRSASASEVRRPRTKDRATKFHVVQTAILREDAMNATNPFASPIHHKTIRPRFHESRRTGLSPNRTHNGPGHEVHLYLRVLRRPHHLQSNPTPLSMAASHRGWPGPDCLGSRPHRDHHLPALSQTKFGVRRLV